MNSSFFIQINMAKNNKIKEICVECDKACDGGIECNKCNKWSHYSCTQLTITWLILLQHSKRSYLCSECIKTKIIEFKKHYDMLEVEVVNEIQQIELEKCAKDIDLSAQINKITNTKPNLEKESSPQTPKTTIEENSNIPENIGLNAPERKNIRNSAKTVLKNSEETKNHLANDSGNIKKKTSSFSTTQQKVNVDVNKKSNIPICRFYEKRICKHGSNGANCNYSHPKQCQKFIKYGFKDRRGCNLKEKCTNYHPKLCRFAIKNNACYKQDCTYLHIQGTQRGKKLETKSEFPLLNLNKNKKNTSNENVKNTELKNKSDFLDCFQHLQYELQGMIQNQFLEIKNNLGLMRTNADYVAGPQKMNLLPQYMKRLDFPAY